MLYLQTFGGLSITNGGRPIVGAAAQRGRLALLAYLAAAGSPGVSRDRALAVFWPESDTDRARSALRQALYALRRDIGEQDLTLGNTELRLNPGVIESDVAEFARQLEAGSLESAVRLYRGPFLEGIHLKDSPEFEDWAERQRDRLRHSYRQSLERLAKAASDRRDLEAAAEWSRLRAGDDPLSGKSAHSYMEALAAAGHREAAIQHARAYSDRVRIELEADPDPRVIELAARLSAASSAQQARARAVRILEAPAAEHVVPTNSSRDATTDVDTRRERLGTRARVIAAAACAATLVSAAALVIRQRSQAARVDPHLMVVLPFSVAGPSDDRFLGIGVARLLSHDLDGVDGGRVVEPAAVLEFAGLHGPSPDSAGSAPSPDQVAAHFGAEYYVAGDIVVYGDSAIVRAAEHRWTPTDSVLRRAESSGPLREVFRLADRVTAQLATDSLKAVDAGLAQAALTTNSLEAFKTFLEGEDALNQWRFKDARDLLQRATSLDTTFALAYYRLSIAADWTGNSDLMRWAQSRATRFKHHLDAHQRLLVESRQAWLESQYDDAERLVRRVVVQWPTDAEAWYQLGEVLFHSNFARGRPIDEANEPFEQTVRLDPRHWDSWLHLGRLAAMRGDRADADADFGRVIAALPDSLTLDARVLSAFLDDDTARETAVLAELRRRSEADVFTECSRVAVWVHQLQGAERICSLLTLPGRPVGSVAAGIDTKGYIQQAAGIPALARAEISNIPGEMRAWRAEDLAWLECRPSVPVDSARTRAARDSVFAVTEADIHRAAALSWWGMMTSSTRVYLLGRLSGCLGDASAFQHWTAELEHFSTRDTLEARTARRLSSLLTAEQQSRRGNWSDALRRLNASDTIRLHTFDGTAAALSRYIRADVLAHLGRKEEAIGWFESFDGLQVVDLSFASAAYRRAATLARELGESARASADSSAAYRLWRGSESARYR